MPLTNEEFKKLFFECVDSAIDKVKEIEAMEKKSGAGVGISYDDFVEQRADDFRDIRFWERRGTKPTGGIMKTFTPKDMHNNPAMVYRAADKDGEVRIDHDRYPDRIFTLTARDMRVGDIDQEDLSSP